MSQASRQMSQRALKSKLYISILKTYSMLHFCKFHFTMASSSSIFLFFIRLIKFKWNKNRSSPYSKLFYYLRVVEKLWKLMPCLLHRRKNKLKGKGADASLSSRKKETQLSFSSSPSLHCNPLFPLIHSLFISLACLVLGYGVLYWRLRLAALSHRKKEVKNRKGVGTCGVYLLLVLPLKLDTFGYLLKIFGFMTKRFGGHSTWIIETPDWQFIMIKWNKMKRTEGSFLCEIVYIPTFVPKI